MQKTQKRQRIWKGKKMDNPKKLATHGTQDEDKQNKNKQNKNTTQYVLDTTTRNTNKHKQRK